MIIRLYNSKLDSNFLNFEFGSENYNYLVFSLRSRVSDTVHFFNEKDGEFCFRIISISKKELVLTKDRFISTAFKSKNLTLAFCIPKLQYLSQIIDRCTQVGITTFLPISSDFSCKDSKINYDKLQKIATQAVEQSGGFYLPKIMPEIELEKFLSSQNDTILFANERHILENSFSSFSLPSIGLIGPEGGFSAKEIDIILSCKNVVSCSLGRNILKCDTAATVISFFLSRNLV